MSREVAEGSTRSMTSVLLSIHGVMIMVASRTGSAKWKRIRRTVINEARNADVTHCPGYEHHPCGRVLDYETAGLPDSVEVDHIIPHGHGGEDSVENARVMCFTCNRGRGTGYIPPVVPSVDEFPLDGDWFALVVPVNADAG